MSSGPVEQLRPMTSTFRASSVVSTELMSVAQQHLAAVGQQRDGGLDRDRAVLELHGLARAEDRGLDLQDVLGGLDDDEVRAAADQALGLLGEHGDEVAEADVAERRVVRRRQVARRADRARHEAVGADRLAGDLGGLDVDLERMVGRPLLELQAAGLERVGLDDLRARLDHRRVDALDDVRAVRGRGPRARAREACSRPRARGRTARASRPCRRRRRRRARGWP